MRVTPSFALAPRLRKKHNDLKITRNRCKTDQLNRSKRAITGEPNGNTPQTPLTTPGESSDLSSRSLQLLGRPCHQGRQVVHTASPSSSVAVSAVSASRFHCEPWYDLAASELVATALTSASACGPRSRIRMPIAFARAARPALRPVRVWLTPATLPRSLPNSAAAQACGRPRPGPV